MAASLERLNKEVSQNIEMIDKVLTDFDDGREDLSLGREALNACEVTPEGQAALERSLYNFTDDVQPNFVTVALDQLAGHVRYQDLLSTQFQQDFATYAGRLKEENEQLTSHYQMMWSHHINFHPDVSGFFGSDIED